MIELKTSGKKILELEVSSIEKILSIYPDEQLVQRSVFVDALSKHELSYSDLKRECETLQLPWQLFFLNPDNLNKHITAISRRRSAKFDKKLIASRDDEGRGVSLRIADRLIALQEFARENVSKENDYSGSMKNLHRDMWGDALMQYFGITHDKLRGGKKEKKLDYLIELAELHNIRVARGVLSNGLLPAAKEIKGAYSKSSGFIVNDKKVPYVFLPNEVKDNESAGRQILTLITLLILIGVDEYNVYVPGTIGEMLAVPNRLLRQALGVASEILLPFDESNKYEDVTITPELRDELATNYMLTPSAIVVTLRRRDLISDTELNELLDSIQAYKDTGRKNTPKISTSTRKLCGDSTHNEIIRGIRSGTLKSIDAQYLIFGRVNKLKYEKYKASIGI